MEALRADIKEHTQRIAAINFETMSSTKMGATLKQELDNILALIEAQMAASEERFGELEEQIEEQADVIDELIDQAEDTLQPETAALIVGVFGAGLGLAVELEGLAATLTDDIRKKKLLAAAAAYRQHMGEVMAVVAAATLEPDDEGDSDEDAQADLIEGDATEDDDETEEEK